MEWEEDMARTEFDLSPEDRELLARLGDVVSAEDQMPAGVAEAAKALHDWVSVDAILAELVAEPVSVRGDGTAYTYAVGAALLRAEIEPAGYRRRRLIVTAHEAGQSAARVQAQRGDGTVAELATDRFGQCALDMPTGPVRLIAQFAATRIATPWFTL